MTLSDRPVTSSDRPGHMSDEWLPAQLFEQFIDNFSEILRNVDFEVDTYCIYPWRFLMNTQITGINFVERKHVKVRDMNKFEEHLHSESNLSFIDVNHASSTFSFYARLPGRDTYNITNQTKEVYHV